MRAEISKEMSNYVSDGQWQFLQGKMQPRRFSCQMSERKPADKSDFTSFRHLPRSFQLSNEQPRRFSCQMSERKPADKSDFTSFRHLLGLDSKTEFMIVGTRQQLAKVNINQLCVGESSIVPVTSVKNLGSWFDKKHEHDYSYY